jgi:hypothetical protein
MVRATIYKFENISSGFKPEPLQLWFKTAADEGIISSGWQLEPLLIS